MDRSKISKQITQIQGEISVLKQEIGDIVHKNRNDEFTIELVQAQLLQIEEKEAVIVNLEVQVDELNELIRLAGADVKQ